MATLLVDLGGYIDTNFASLTLGTNFFYGFLPETPDNCVAIYENSGVSSIYTQGTVNTPAIERPQLQILVRNSSYENGIALANSLYLFITAIANQTINGIRYLRVVAISNPSVIERDHNKRIVFSCNFDVQRII